MMTPSNLSSAAKRATKKSGREIDVIIHGGGTIYQVYPVTQRAKDWIDENVQTEGWQWMGPTLAVGHRYVLELVAGMQRAGLEVR